MSISELNTRSHPAENDLAGFLAGLLPKARRVKVEDHIAECDECLAAVVSAYESVASSGNIPISRRGSGGIMKKLNIYLMMAILSFALSFITPRYFIQLLVATTLLGIKWIADSKSARMLVMIYEAWKNGGEKEASQVLKRMEERAKIRI